MNDVVNPHIIYISLYIYYTATIMCVFTTLIIHESMPKINILTFIKHLNHIYEVLLR